ncbi:High-light-induced protein [Nymphaea thermarum]|nr:High-light-induced protein [Nymphaea thermarum]
MAASASMCTLLPTRLSGRPTRQSFFHSTTHQRPHKPNYRLRVQAAKLPAGVELPKEKPKLTSPVFGFTRTAEIWNSRACMIGLIGTFIVELVRLMRFSIKVYWRSLESMWEKDSIFHYEVVFPADVPQVL